MRGGREGKHYCLRGVGRERGGSWWRWRRRWLAGAEGQRCSGSRRMSRQFNLTVKCSWLGDAKLQCFATAAGAHPVQCTVAVAVAAYPVVIGCARSRGPLYAQMWTNS